MTSSLYALLIIDEVIGFQEVHLAKSNFKVMNTTLNYTFYKNKSQSFRNRHTFPDAPS